jgi:hypothetical protein
MLRPALAVIACAVLVTPASAVTVVPLTFEQLVSQSAAVVVGRVVDVRGDFTDDRKGIQSNVTVEVLRGIKGHARGTVTFAMPGGQAGRYVNVIAGAPTLARGDVGVFFLSSRGARLPVTTGFTQGIFRVGVNAANEVFVVHKAPVPLRVFEANIRAVVDAAK